LSIQVTNHPEVSWQGRHHDIHRQEVRLPKLRDCRQVSALSARLRRFVPLREVPVFGPEVLDGGEPSRGGGATMPANDARDANCLQVEISGYVLSKLPKAQLRPATPTYLERERFYATYFTPFCLQATVSRRTSSIVVTPFRIFCRPDSRNVIMPSSIDFLRSSSEEAPIRISSRISSVTSITS